MLHQYYVLDRYFLYTIYIYMHAIPLTNLLFLEKSDQSSQYSYNASLLCPLPTAQKKGEDPTKYERCFDRENDAKMATYLGYL